MNGFINHHQLVLIWCSSTELMVVKSGSWWWQKDVKSYWLMYINGIMVTKSIQLVDVHQWDNGLDTCWSCKIYGLDASVGGPKPWKSCCWTKMDFVHPQLILVFVRTLNLVEVLQLRQVEFHNTRQRPNGFEERKNLNPREKPLHLNIKTASPIITLHQKNIDHWVGWKEIMQETTSGTSTSPPRQPAVDLLHISPSVDPVRASVEASKCVISDVFRGYIVHQKWFEGSTIMVPLQS